MGDLPQLSLFTVSTVDPPWRDNRDVMGYPMLSLEKRRTKPIEYERNGVRVSVAADSRFSIASIWDWDLIIFAASHLNQAIEDGRQPSSRISFAPCDCLEQIRRRTSGLYYRRLAEAIRALQPAGQQEVVGVDGEEVPLAQDRPI